MTTDICYRDPEGKGWRSYATGEYIHGGIIGWPSVENTGWAATGLEELGVYGGTHFITTDTIIDALEVNLPDSAMFIEEGAQVRITRSLVNAFIDANADESGATLRIYDSNIICPPLFNPAIGYSRLDIRRCNIRGGQHSVLGAHDTRIEDSILWDQYNDPNPEIDGYHNNAYISNGGSHVLLLHNTLDCSTELTPENDGGPTGDASVFGDFGPVHDFTFDRCLFKATTGGFGLSAGWNPGKPYGDDPYNIVVRDCVFERGITGHNGVFGPVTSFKVAGPGNVWENNRYDDGTLIGPDGQELDG